MTRANRDLWLDGQGAQNRAHFDRGIPRFVNEQLRHVVQRARERVRAVSLNPALPLTGNLNWLLGRDTVSWDGGRGLRPAPLPRIYHAMSPFELDRSLDELWPAWARTPEVRTVVTLFDLIPLVFAEHYLQAPGIRARYMARTEFVRAADHVLAISATTAHDAERLLNIASDRITVIDAGVSNHFAEAYGSAEEARHIVRRTAPEVKKGFLLYVAGIEFRKNIERLITAYGLTAPQFRAAHQLVITCRMLPAEEAHLRRCAAQAKVGRDELVLTNYVTDAELAALYRTCALFVFASFYEGSGLPILEAMSCGAPVIASSTSTSPEILGDSAGTFDPYDPVDMARVLEETVGDPELMRRLTVRSVNRAGRYTWDRVAVRTLEGYERALAESQPSRRRTARARLALFSPWPPERSGVATYSRRLVQELSRSVDVDVIVAQDTRCYPSANEIGTSLTPAKAFDARRPLRAYDRLLYCMGNSHFHGYIYEQLRRDPGVVLAHDVRLAGFYGWYSGTERPDDPSGRLRERIQAMYGSRLGPLDGAIPTPLEQSALGIYMTQELQEYAEHVVVHSEYARDILRLDRPRLHGEQLPASVLPHAFPEVRVARANGADPAAPLIVSFGIVSSTKNPRALIEAFAMLVRDRPGARLVFAGGGDDAELRHWRSVAADADVEDKVVLIGHASDAQWHELLRTTDLAVQLRLMSNGEASGAVCECLAAGLPTIVTDHGWAAELPRDAVASVPIEVTAAVLAGAMSAILDDSHRAAELSVSARSHARANGFPAVAQRYLELLELV